MTAGGSAVGLAGVERVDEVRDLWLALHHHHRAVVGPLPLIEHDEVSWQRRRALYVERLGSGSGFLALATEGEAVVGYALVCIEEGPDDTFPLGDRYAELYSLSVAPHFGSADNCAFGQGNGRVTHPMTSTFTSFSCRLRS